MKWLIVSAVGMALWLSMAGLARAEDGKTYAIKAEATRFGNDEIAVTATVTCTTDGKTETRSSPRLLFRDGQRASITLGTLPEAAGDAALDPPVNQTLLIEGSVVFESGLQIDVISTKGKSEVLLVSIVTEKGEIVWADARTVKIEDAPAGKAHAARRPASLRSAASTDSAYRVVIDWKYRRPSDQGDWNEGTTRCVLRAGAPISLWAENRRMNELIKWDDAGPTIRGLNGRLVPAEPGDFDAGQSRASADLFKSAGQAPCPVAPGKVFAIRYGDPSRGGEGEALIRIESIEPSGRPATQPAAAR